MTVAEIIQFIRNIKKPTVSMIDDATLLTYINQVYPKIYKKVVDLDKNYFRGRRTSNFVAGQSQYSLVNPDTGTSTFGQWAIEKVWVKYDEDEEEYTSAQIISFDRLNKDISWYEKNANEYEPFAIIASRSIFIYPTPDDSVSSWLKFEWAKKPYPLSLTSDADDILLPSEYHDIIWRGVVPYVYHEREMIGEKNDAISEYERRLREMQEDLTNITTTLVYKPRQNLSYLE